MSVETGRIGEERVSEWLEKKGWQVIARNWRTRTGEIDIIARDFDSIVFVEVKTWPHSEPADLELVIGARKQKRMVETAKCFLDGHRQYNGMYVRFDVILVTSVPQRAELFEIHHFKDAFSERM